MENLRRVIPYLMVLMAVVLQTTAIWQFTLFDIRTDLVLVAVVLYGLSTGGGSGALLGLWGGFLEDLLVGRYIGLHALALGAAGLLSGALGRRMVRENLLAVLLIVIMAGLVEGGILGVIYDIIFAGKIPLSVLLRTVVLAAGYNIVPTLLIRWVRQRRRRRDRLGVFG